MTRIITYLPLLTLMTAAIGLPAVSYSSTPNEKVIVQPYLPSGPLTRPPDINQVPLICRRLIQTQSSLFRPKPGELRVLVGLAVKAPNIEVPIFLFHPGVGSHEYLYGVAEKQFGKPLDALWSGEIKIAGIRSREGPTTELTGVNDTSGFLRRREIKPLWNLRTRDGQDKLIQAFFKLSRMDGLFMIPRGLNPQAYTTRENEHFSKTASIGSKAIRHDLVTALGGIRTTVEQAFSEVKDPTKPILLSTTGELATELFTMLKNPENYGGEYDAYGVVQVSWDALESEELSYVVPPHFRELLRTSRIPGWVRQVRAGGPLTKHEADLHIAEIDHFLEEFRALQAQVVKRVEFFWGGLTPRPKM